MQNTDALTLDFTPRILPHHALALGPEVCRIVWQK
jgi:hypothetical protein